METQSVESVSDLSDDALNETLCALQARLRACETGSRCYRLVKEAIVGVRQELKARTRKVAGVDSTRFKDF